ncbi:MAG: hypothetical protein KF715_05645 [Candidatus Didemnitutus sp.]|nr:hypothetical protein [Candidatus Didemnitutus sp.]
MKIAFVTGCLEPGRDGVGDYVRTLAAECTARGHAVRLLSLADTVDLSADGGTPPTRRQTLAATCDDDGRGARAWLDEFRPDWTSLHFVPYAFHPRGLFAGRLPPLRRVLAAGARRHVFFHEIWIGFARGAPWKERAFGFLQRRALARLLHTTAPTAVHTSNGCYRRALAGLGCAASELPMFGSVPLRPGVVPAALPGVGADALVCGMFGAVHPNWEHEPFLSDFAQLAAARGRRAVLAAAGSLRQGEVLFPQLAAHWRGRIDCLALGLHPPAQLAEFFARFDFAVTTSPFHLVGKSSSAAALREHGLRVVVTNSGQPPRFAATPEDLAPADAGFLPYFRARESLPQALERTPPRPGASRTAEMFLAALAAHD